MPQQSIKEYIQSLSHEEQILISKRLLACAAREIAKYRGRLRLTAEDLINEVLEKLLSGERKWDTDKYPIIEMFEDRACHIIRSVANNNIRNNYHKIVEINTGSIELSAISVEDEIIREEEKLLFFEYVKDNYSYLLDFLISKINGEKPKETAEKLNISAKDVYEKNRQLSRILLKFKNKLVEEV